MAASAKLTWRLLEIAAVESALGYGYTYHPIPPANHLIEGNEMAAHDGISHWQENGNPFPPTAVARVSDLRPKTPTIKTAAVREVDRLIDGYLRATKIGYTGSLDKTGEQLANAGRVCVICGDYGTGKTHLAIEIIDRIEDARTDSHANTQVFYHMAQGENFLTLYGDLMSRVIGRSEVLGRVREFYADIVADALRDRFDTRSLVTELGRGNIDPQVVINRYGLREGTLRTELRQRLSSVTKDEAFTRALILMLEPELQDMAWDWFVGGTPSNVLVERGVTKSLETDSRAMEALGIIARLYGRKNRRFVLIIDELEKIALTWDRSDPTKAQAFKNLFEVFHDAGALLVICGLPDIFAVLPRDPGRIDAIIEPSLLTHDDVRWYIEETQKRFPGKPTLEPFTSESISYTIYVTGGVARDVFRICYYAYDHAVEARQEITPAVIILVARSRISRGIVENVRTKIGELSNEHGWSINRYWPFGDPPDMAMDFWIPWNDQGDGCAVLISDSVLEEQYARRLMAKFTAFRSAAPGRAVILVVSGYLPVYLRQVFADALGDDSLIVYSVRTFDKDFPLAVKLAMERILSSDPGRRQELRADFDVAERRLEETAAANAAAMRITIPNARVIAKPGNLAGHAFISYVREDSSQVDRLQQMLQSAGILVWRDTTDLWPGEDWRAKIRRAITDNALAFIACFSRASLSRGKTYHNEELTLAIEQLRLRPPDDPWLIPVRLDECQIPDRDIGGGRTLTSIQRADLFGDHFHEGAERLVAAILRILG